MERYHTTVHGTGPEKLNSLISGPDIMIKGVITTLLDRMGGARNETDLSVAPLNDESVWR